MRKVQKYIVKDNKIFVGLEDSKKSWKICVRSAKMIVHQTSMPAQYENLRNYLMNKYPNCEIKLMYEAGFSGFWLHDLLEEDGIKCIVTPANRVVMEKVNSVKTDKRDARRLSKNLENDDYTVCYVPDQERREDRQISRTLLQIQKDITRNKNRIRKFLDFHGLNQGLPSGSWTDSDYEKLHTLQVSKSLKICLNIYLRQFEELLCIKNELKQELKELCEKERYKQSVKLKESCPGIGWFSAIRFTLEWGEMSRFKTGKNIASFLGLTCSEYSTGETIRKGRITGHSNKGVRAWIIQCAWASIKKDPVLLKKYRTVMKNTGNSKKAIVAVARKLVVRMRAVELSKTPYCFGVIE